MRKLYAAVLLCGAALVSTNAFAVLANATFSGTVTVGGFTGPNLRQATQIRITNPSFVFDLPATYLGNPNVFVSNGNLSLGDQASFPTVINLPPSLPINNFLLFTTANGNDYRFSLTSYTQLPSADNTHAFYGKGQFTDSTGFYDPTDDVSFQWSLINVGGSATGSFRWGTPAFENPAPVPAPGALALVALGLIGLRVARRKAA